MQRGRPSLDRPAHPVMVAAGISRVGTEEGLSFPVHLRACGRYGAELLALQKGVEGQFRQTRIIPFPEESEVLMKGGGCRNNLA